SEATRGCPQRVTELEWDAVFRELDILRERQARRIVRNDRVEILVDESIQAVPVANVRGSGSRLIPRRSGPIRFANDNAEERETRCSKGRRFFLHDSPELVRTPLPLRLVGSGLFPT